MNRTTEKIPTWSLCYLINGDATALTDEEIRMVDEWVSQCPIVSPPAFCSRQFVSEPAVCGLSLLHHSLA